MNQNNKDEQAMERDDVTHSFPPSHFLQDGRFIFLPEPSKQERTKFLERSITRHKLLSEKVKEDEKEVEEDDKDLKQIKVHPLALASARLQANGVSELSKAINLSTLVSSGEYFGLSNIINPQLEVGMDKTSEKEVEVPVNLEDVGHRSLYLVKRKRAQFKWAAEALERHEKRLAGSVVTQQIIDQRLLALRPRWRLAAPEHGIRARPHATRPTEVIAIDVDVYDRDRTGGGNQASMAVHHAPRAAIGLARLVPRYATVELPKDYIITEDVDHWKKEHSLHNTLMNDEHSLTEGKTRAEPFAIADPTLGKIDLDFNPNKVPMLSLQLDIEKDITGFRQSARLSPLTILGEKASEDEKVVVALQHSLFCASLFESIRRELIHEDAFGNDGKEQTTQHTSDVWLSSAVEEHYLPTCPRVGTSSSGNRGMLAIVHCHEGEVKVQLDSEYTLAIKLVEAGTATAAVKGDDDDMHADKDEQSRKSNKLSGSQSPQQLHALCRALLLHAQDVYHRHSIELREHMVKKKKEEQTTKKIGLETRKKEDEIPSALILQNCVSLCVRMISEGKVRWALARVTKWLGLKSQGVRT